MPVPLYATDTEPCIPVRLLDGHQEYLGWRDIIVHAHEIEDLALPLPPAGSAALRVLVAIAARITTLDDTELSTGEWAARRRALLQQPAGFDDHAVHAYFDAHTWDLFAEQRPFLQDPRLTVQCDEPAGVNKLVFGRPEGNNLAWLSPHTDTDPQPVPSDQALWHLLIHHFYGAAGRCRARTVGDKRSASGTAGPLRSTISFHPLGRTLHETLLAGLPHPADDWPEADDHCPWEEPQLPDPAGPLPPVTWPGRLLTGRSRHAALLIPSKDGKQVTEAYLTWATGQAALPAIDPYLIHHVDPEQPVAKRHKPRRADADRALWRDLDALLLVTDETSTVQRPTAFAHLNDLPPALRARLRVRAYGFDQDGKTNNRTWYTSLTPPIWPWTQEHNPATAQRIAECRAAAEEIGALLDTVSQQAWRELTTPGRTTAPKKLPAWSRNTRAQYWPRAETTFRRLLDDPSLAARPAFATDAVTVLRAVTRPAVTRHFRAAQTIATAVARLRRTS
ncbi:type I-E CRISPR-associated protein Cse1/CasA [Streptomyces sp. NPDC007074]|uniref:type I-E CRISPR-associated protein Cse1/CasA n=1 Tax=Streptomyces sp. NPDC007074 TaxID=3156764 RepID=UPI0033E8AD2C